MKAKNNELFQQIVSVLEATQDMANGMHQYRHDETIETTLKRETPAAQAALETLRQQVADLEALSDAVAELARIELAYKPGAWPEWDAAFAAVYAINKKIRNHD